MHVCMAKEIDMMTIDQTYTYFHIRALWDAHTYTLLIIMHACEVTKLFSKLFVNATSSWPYHHLFNIFLFLFSIPLSAPFSISLFLPRPFVLSFLVLAATHRTHVCAAEYPKVNFQLLAQPFARVVYMCVCVYIYRYTFAYVYCIHHDKFLL